MNQKATIILIHIFIIIMLFCSCITTFKVADLMLSGELKQNEFSVELPFEYNSGFVILAVNIRGEKYNFLLDSGSPNIIDIDLAKKLDLKSEFYKTIQDAQGNKSDMGMTTIDTISIGNLDFINTGVAIIDLKESKEISCLNIAGVIGANLINMAIWKIDFVDQLITLSNSSDELIPSEEEILKIPIYTHWEFGTPYCDMTVDDQKISGVIIDLGSNGGFSVSKEDILRISKYNPQLSIGSSNGVIASGFFGTGEAVKNLFLQSSTVAFGEVIIEDAIIVTSAFPTIGTRFLKNYDVVFDLQNKEVLLISRSQFIPENSSLGFSCRYDNENLIIGNVFAESEAESVLKLGDEILEINGTDYRNMSLDRWCAFLNNSPLVKDSISLIIQRETNQFSLQFKRESIIK